MFFIWQNRVQLAMKRVEAAASRLFFSYSFSYSSSSTEAQRHASFLGHLKNPTCYLKICSGHTRVVSLPKPNQTKPKKMQEKPYVGDLGQDSLFLMVPLSSKGKQVGVRVTAVEHQQCRTSPCPQAFSDEHDRIGTKYKQGSEEKEDPFLVSFSSLVCFHQYFQFMIQKNSKTNYSLTIRL